MNEINKVLSDDEVAQIWGSGIKLFELITDSMDDGTSRAMYIGDILKGRECEQRKKISASEAESYPVVVVTHDSILVGSVTHNEEGAITLSKYNPAFKDVVIDLTKVETIYLIESIQRDMTPKAKAKRAKYRNK
jgi:hypothetical protein